MNKRDALSCKVPNIAEFLHRDPNLEPFKNYIERRYASFANIFNQIQKTESIEEFTRAYREYGIHIHADNSITALEWAPGAKGMSLIGEFNDWNCDSHKFTKLQFGKWKLVIPPLENGECAIRHLSEVKLSITSPSGDKLDRLSPWATYVIPSQYPYQNTYSQRIWHPPPEEIYSVKYSKPPKPRSLRIYECHVGIATSEFRVGTYAEFTKDILPRIVNQGYNAIQLMAIMEHAYYGSFGYQVTSFFATSSRYGTPEELKELVDTAHKYKLYVLLDIVHSHASKNTLDGLNMFDGTDSCYFHSGEKGTHPLWDSRLFNYGEYETVRFLITNVFWYLDQYNFDGLRFDGVTSIIYKSRGTNENFSGDYNEYYGDHVDEEGITYLMLMNYISHMIHPEIITIAEDVSGMPGTCRPVTEGGLGFDYRLGMAIPDKWIQILKEKKDEEWNMGDIVWTLTNRRWMEKTIAYVESHDQSLVGDKTIAFWLMDQVMYTHMSILAPPNLTISRGIALHNLILLITHALGGEGFLNFMGNEFGHPEWLDFPRKENNESYHYARRQWHLVDDPMLKYKFMNAWDRDVNFLEEEFGWLNSHPGYVFVKHESDKIIGFERNGLTFVFNFHPDKSFPDYPIPVRISGVYQIILNSDESKYGGFERVDINIKHISISDPMNDYPNRIKIYIPARTALIFRLQE